MNDLRFAFRQLAKNPGFTAIAVLTLAHYHSYSHWATLLAHIKQRANQRCAGWEADLIELPEEVLISETKSKM